MQYRILPVLMIIVLFGSFSGENFFVYQVPEVKYPIDNPYSEESVELGKMMFFNVGMSRDSSLSCASCHAPTRAFSDGLPKSIGKDNSVLDRNAPSLVNVGFQESGFLWDKGVPSLEMQVLVPVQEHKEFDFNFWLIAERFKKDSSMVQLAKKAYQREIDAFVITRAIANYQRSLVDFESRFDSVMRGELTFSQEEQLGYQLFFGKANCSECHSGMLLSDFSLKNNGLYDYPYPADSGRMRVSKKEEDRDLFKVPSLRHVALTSPYMHDGSISALKDVVDHYNKGGETHSNKDQRVKELHLSSEEKLALVEFLKSLN